MIFTTLSSHHIKYVIPNSFYQIELITDHCIVEFSINIKFTNIKFAIHYLTSTCPVMLNSVFKNININVPTKTILINDLPFYPWKSHEIVILKKGVCKFEKKCLKILLLK